MLQLKPLRRDAIPAALAKAERYRLLNEAWQAESICQDVLRVDPENQTALVMLILALTDQFHQGMPVQEARDVVPRLHDEYERAYYSGVICERRAKAVLEQGRQGSGHIVYESLREAMNWYEKAEAIRPPANDDAILRWNTCARFFERYPHLKPAAEERAEPVMLE
jgi:tetratricopeptide (TPR) repeat protein